MSEKERNGLGTSHESVGSTPPDILEMQKSLQKIGLTVTEDILRRIGEKTETKNAFENDIKALLSQNPPNPNEVQRLEVMWVQAYGKKVETNYGVLAFAEILKHEKKKEIVDKMNDSDFDIFDKWMKEQIRTTIDQNNEKKERLTRLNDQLSIGLENLKRFKNLPTPSTEALRQNAKNVPELQGISETEIQSGAYDRILLADYYISHKGEIITQLPPEDRKEFEITINTLSDTLGRERKDDFKALTDSLVLGEDRAKIESAGNNLIDRGYNREVAWDPQTRRFTFENALGEKRIIETARIPPQESIENGVLRLSRDVTLPPETPETQARKKTEQEIDNSIESAIKSPQIGALDNQNQTIQNVLKQIQKIGSYTDKINQTLKVLGEKKKLIEEAMNGQVQGSADWKDLSGHLDAVNRQISTLTAIAQRYIAQKATEKETRKDEIDPFHTGTENLNGLTETRLGDMKDMGEVIAFLQTQNGTNFGNNLTDAKSINTYLMTEQLSQEQKRSLFQNIVKLYINITGDKDIQQKTIVEQFNFLRTATENGKTRLQNALQRERTARNGRTTLRREDFASILSREEQK